MYLLAAACREKDVLGDLIQTGLLTKEEAAIIELVNANQRPMILWAWILRITYESPPREFCGGTPGRESGETGGV